VLLTVYGQLILKWRLQFFGAFPLHLKEQFLFLGNVLLDPYVLSSFIAAFLASLTWIAALTKFQISYAYPFMSLSFILVLWLSFVFFHEPLTLNKIMGTLFILVGLLIASK
jgi:uncharacterized membrane protein